MRLFANLLTIAVLVCALTCGSAAASPFFFSTGLPNGRMASGARIPQPGVLGIETADDFILNAPNTFIQHATFTGLLVGAAPTLIDVNVDLYRVFPADSDTARTPNVNTRTNSPADTEFDGRSFLGGGLTGSALILDPQFAAANSVLNGINSKPITKTGCEGPEIGSELRH